MPNIQPDPSLIKNINKEACNVCQEGSSYNVCMVPPEALVNTNHKCKTKCSDQYNSVSYFYDKDGTQRCYCGKTKISCEQASSINNPCDGNGRDMCVLRPNDLIGNTTVSDNVNNNDMCKLECKNILQSDGLYCYDSNKCICTNPVPILNPIPTPTPPVNPICNASDTALYCFDNTQIQSESNKILPDTYMKYGYFLGPTNNNDSVDVKTAFCDCDGDIALTYNKYFPSSMYPIQPTLGSIWVEAVKATADKNNKDLLYRNFNAGVNKVTGGDIDKIKVLSAYEMCRVTNDKYKRTKEEVSPNPSTDFEGWLKYHLGDKAESGRLLNIGVEILVMAMLVHILFRTLIPSMGSPRESLIYAMFMPQQYVVNDNAKILVLGASISLMLFIMGVSYFVSITNTLIVLYSIAGAIVLGFIISFFRLNWLSYGLYILPIVAILILLLYFSKDKGFIGYFIPQSIPGILTSGFALSIYAVIVGALLSGNTRTPVQMVLILIGIIFATSIVLGIYGPIIGDNSFIVDNKYSRAYFIIAACLLIIYLIFSFVPGVGILPPNFISYVLSTLFGVLPLATFAIILNFAIAHYSPAIEILFLVIYRVIGFWAVNSPTSSIGKMLLKISGKRITDKWVLPFLPWVTYIIDVYYLVSGGAKPPYYTRTGIATGVRNSDMWLS